MLTGLHEALWLITSLLMTQHMNHLSITTTTQARLGSCEVKWKEMLMSVLYVKIYEPQKKKYVLQWFRKNSITLSCSFSCCWDHTATFWIKACKFERWRPEHRCEKICICIKNKWNFSLYLCYWRCLSFKVFPQYNLIYAAPSSYGNTLSCIQKVQNIKSKNTCSTKCM